MVLNCTSCHYILCYQAFTVKQRLAVLKNDLDEEAKIMNKKKISIIIHGPKTFQLLLN